MPVREFMNKRLASGQATGAIHFPTKEGSGVLRVRVKERGRGLFAASHIPKDIQMSRTTICCLFCLSVMLIIPIVQDIASHRKAVHSFPSLDMRQRRISLWFKKIIIVFDPPSDGYLAVLCNAPLTEAGSARSNAYCARNARSTTPVVNVTSRMWRMRSSGTDTLLKNK